MFHGQKDGIVPVSFSKVLSIFTKAKKRIVILKNGDHKLISSFKNLNKILSELKRFSKQIS